MGFMWRVIKKLLKSIDKSGDTDCKLIYRGGHLVAKQWHDNVDWKKVVDCLLSNTSFFQETLPRKSVRSFFASLITDAISLVLCVTITWSLNGYRTMAHTDYHNWPFRGYRTTAYMSMHPFNKSPCTTFRWKVSTLMP